MDLQKTGALIAAARKEKGLTQQQLARQLHISHTTVSKWERGLASPRSLCWSRWRRHWI